MRNVISAMPRTAVWGLCGRTQALRHAAAADQVYDQYDQGNYQQQVNQTAGHVEAKTEKPQNHKHNENCPQHFDLLLILCAQLNVREDSPKLAYPAGASDFPHSRQDVLVREVIKPQNGHILCDA
jgi:hypothetical protein